jgi:hypothetical protein
VGVTDHSAVGVGGTLHDLVVAASSLLDPAALAKIAVKEVCRLLDVDGATLSFWDSDQRLLVPLAFNDTHVGEPFPVFHPGQGLIGEAFSRQVPVIVSDYRPRSSAVSVSRCMRTGGWSARCPARRITAATSLPLTSR